MILSGGIFSISWPDLTCFIQAIPDIEENIRDHQDSVPGPVKLYQSLLRFDNNLRNSIYNQTNVISNPIALNHSIYFGAP